MKKLFLSVAAVGLLGGSAIAADLPVYEPAPVIAPVPTSFSWTGFYAGAAVGYGWGDAEINTFRPTDDGRRRGDEEFDVDGFLGGVFAGYNYQFASPLVLGVEADLEIAGIDGDGEDLFDDEDEDDDMRFDADLDFQGSLRGRVGFAADRALFYATAGVAFADIEGKLNGDTDGDGDRDGDDDEFGEGDIKGGWTVGAGVDFAVTDNVFVRGEYRYTDYADFNNDEDERGDVQDLELHTFRVGAGFKF